MASAATATPDLRANDLSDNSLKSIPHPFTLHPVFLIAVRGIEFRRPRNQGALRKLNHVVEQEAQNRDDDKRCKNQRGVELGRGKLDDVAEPSVGAGELTNDGADDAEGDRNLEAGHQVRK